MLTNYSVLNDLGNARRRRQEPKRAPVLARGAGRVNARPTQSGNISQFTFKWRGVSNAADWTYLGSLKDNHAKFNAKIIANFPKLAHAQPFTSYADRDMFLARNDSYISAQGETKLNSANTLNLIIQLAKESGFTGDQAKIEYDQKTIEQIQNNEFLRQPRSVIDRTIENYQNRTRRTQTSQRNSNNVATDTLNAVSNAAENLFSSSSLPISLVAVAAVVVVVILMAKK